MGRHLLELGVQPGPDMGRLLDECYEAQLEGLFSTLDEGLIYTNNKLASFALTRIIHEYFCCNRGDGSQNLMWYSLFAPRSCKGRSIDLACAVATHLDAVGPASRQAGSPLGRSTSCSRMPPSLVGSALKPASPTPTRVPAPL